MKLSDFKKLVLETIKESNEQALVPFQQLAQTTNTVEDFMKKLVGKRLKDLLNIVSISRLYVMNKHPIGSFPSDDDVEALISNLMDSVTAFINFRRLDLMNKQRDEYDKIVRSTPEYSEWNKKRSVAIKNYLNAQRSGDQSVIDKANKEKDDVMSADPTLADYRKTMDDMEKLVNDFHNSPLTLQDVLPSSDDSDKDKQRWQSVKKNFNKLKDTISMNETKLKQLIKQLIKEELDAYDLEGNYPAVTVQVFTGGGREGTTLLLYKGASKSGSERTADVVYKTSTPFNFILNTVNKPSSNRNDEDVKSILRNLTPEELETLSVEKKIVTTNIPNEILDLTGKNIPVDESEEHPAREHPDVELVKWLEKRLDKSLPSDEYQRDRLEKLLVKLKKDLKKESGDPFRDIVKQNAKIYRDNELDRREKEDYARWLATHKPDELKKKLKSLNKNK